MARFYGHRTVMRDLRKHWRTGKVTTSGQLQYRGTTTGDPTTTIDWHYLYIWPQTEMTGLEGAGYADADGMMTLWRTGETITPRVDDRILIGTVNYQIKHITPRLNADESLNFAVYDCVITNS